MQNKKGTLCPNLFYFTHLARFINLFKMSFMLPEAENVIDYILFANKV